MYRYLVLVILLLLFENTMASFPPMIEEIIPIGSTLIRIARTTVIKSQSKNPQSRFNLKPTKNVELSPASGGIRLQGRSSTTLENWTSTTWFLLRKPTNPEPMHGIKQNEKPLRMNSKIRSTLSRLLPQPAVPRAQKILLSGSPPTRLSGSNTLRLG